LTLDKGAAVAQGDVLLTSMTNEFKFRLSVCVQTRDVAQNADKVYTRRATADWTYNGSGTVGGAPAYNWAAIQGATGVTKPNGWAQLKDGTQPKTAGPVLNDLLVTETFN